MKQIKRSDVEKLLRLPRQIKDNTNLHIVKIVFNIYVSGSTSIESQGDGFIVVETNYRIYAYTGW